MNRIDIETWDRQHRESLDQQVEAVPEPEKPEVTEKPLRTAQVRIDLGRVVNMGSYESARIGIGISINCTAEDIEKAFTEARTWVASKVGEEVEKVIQGIAEKVENKKMPATANGSHPF